MTFKKTLDRLEADLAGAEPAAQWTGSRCLPRIGIYRPEHRERSLVIGAEPGFDRVQPASKGCTSPFAPTWIDERVKRQG